MNPIQIKTKKAEKDIETEINERSKTMKTVQQLQAICHNQKNANCIKKGTFI